MGIPPAKDTISGGNYRAKHTKKTHIVLCFQAMNIERYCPDFSSNNKTRPY